MWLSRVKRRALTYPVYQYPVLQSCAEGKVKPKCKDNIYEAATIELLEKACADLKDRVLMVLLVDAGMRVGEVSHALQAWWNGQTLRIPASHDCNCHECRNDKKHPGVWKPKSAAGKRIIPIAPGRQGKNLHLHTELTGVMPAVAGMGQGVFEEMLLLGRKIRRGLTWTW